MTARLDNLVTFFMNNGVDEFEQLHSLIYFYYAWGLGIYQVDLVYDVEFEVEEDGVKVVGLEDVEYNPSTDYEFSENELEILDTILYNYVDTPEENISKLTLYDVPCIEAYLKGERVKRETLMEYYNTMYLNSLN